VRVQPTLLVPQGSRQGTTITITEKRILAMYAKVSTSTVYKYYAVHENLDPCGSLGPLFIPTALTQLY